MSYMQHCNGGCPIFKVYAVHEFSLECLTLEDGMGEGQ